MCEKMMASCYAAAQKQLQSFPREEQEGIIKAIDGKNEMVTVVKIAVRREDTRKRI